jgi:hypothetical protein
MNGRLVRVTAINETDHMHASFFVDPSCWEAGVVDFYEDDRSRGSATGRAFAEASDRQYQADMADGSPEAGKDFRLDVTGVFQWVENPATGIDFQESHARLRVREIHSYEAVDHVFRSELERQRNRCEIRAIIGREIDVASEACDAAAELSHGAGWDLYHRAIVALRQNRLDQAWADFDAAARKDAGVGEYVYGRGVVAQRLGRVDEGRADMERGRALSGGDLVLWPEDLGPN